MFKFIKGNKIQKENETERVNASDVLNTAGKGNEDFDTKLSIPSQWNMTDEERYVYAFHNTQSPQLKKNQISIYGMELLRPAQKNIKITALIRSTVVEPIQFEETTIVLSGSNNEPLARKDFDLQNLGTLPPNSARPWEFDFSEKDFLNDIDMTQPIENWSLGFELKPKHQLDLEESWAKSVAPETRTALEKIVEDAPKLKPGEVNFMGLSAKMKDDNQLVITLLIRNGTDKHVNLEKIPLAVKDASGEEVARGSFTLDDFQVKANTSKPWTFIFPETMVSNKNPDLSRWQTYVIQK